MYIDKKYCPSQEAISYQGKSLFLKELTLAVQSLIDEPKLNIPFFESVGLDKIVKRHTGLNVEFHLDVSSRNMDAYCLPPVLDKNTPLFAPLRRFHNGSAILEAHALTHEQVLEYSRDLRGSINRATGKVSGVFSKIPAPIYLGAGLWASGKLTASETAAIILHEVGHIFSFFETLTQTATTNMVLASAAQSLDGTDNATLRLKLVFQTAEELQVTLEAPEKLADAGVKGELFADILLKAIADKHDTSDTDSLIYDLRSAEFLADQFAARFGAGRDLVVGLDKLMRHAGYEIRRGRAMYMVTQACVTAFTLVAAYALPILTGVAVISLLISSHWMDEQYDEPGARFARIKQDLVQSLKNQTLDPKVRSQILKDIEVIDQLRADVKDRYSYFTYLWVALTSRRRKQFSQMRLQQELEALANNNLFVQSSKLSHMAGVAGK